MVRERHQVPKSYRPLTLLPAMGKVFEEILNKRIVNALERNVLLHDRQYGFKVGKGREDALVSVLEEIKETDKSML